VNSAGEDGGQGGWAILYGSDPLPSGQIHWSIDEEVVAGDTSRTHTTENVGYWVFDNNQTADLEAEKTVSMFSGNASVYSIPGSDVIYTIKADNSGSGPVDSNSIFLVDEMPPEVDFYNGISACNYTPVVGYDPDVTFICFAPKGAMSEGTITGSTFAASFRARIK